ncbi:MAG: hypothetical protein ACK4TD_00605 [Ectopseudomonas guguanensis]|uniref:hypothetical protein n=1 Tax=Ectopseudomonas guguanensis TaxID=1198456 RepID=UPI00391A022A
MTLSEIRDQAITPALALLPARMSSLESEVMLLAIGLQESRFKHRRQLVGSPPRPTGPAKSFWQAEQGGGMVTGLLRYHDDRVRDLAVGLCAVRGVEPSPRAVWNAIERDDVLAAGLARLLLWADPGRLPRLGDADDAWQLYLRTWRPGKPHRSTWDALYAKAVAEVSR